MEQSIRKAILERGYYTCLTCGRRDGSEGWKSPDHAARCNLAGQHEHHWPAMLRRVSQRPGQAYSRTKQVMAAIAHLLWHGYLATDLQQLLFAPGRSGPGSEAPVWLGSAAEEGQP